MPKAQIAMGIEEDYKKDYKIDSRAWGERVKLSSLDV